MALGHGTPRTGGHDARSWHTLNRRSWREVMAHPQRQVRPKCPAQWSVPHGTSTRCNENGSAKPSRPKKDSRGKPTTQNPHSQSGREKHTTQNPHGQNGFHKNICHAKPSRPKRIPEENLQRKTLTAKTGSRTKTYHTGR